MHITSLYVSTFGIRHNCKKRKINIYCSAMHLSYRCNLDISLARYERKDNGKSSALPSFLSSSKFSVVNRRPYNSRASDVLSLSLSLSRGGCFSAAIITIIIIIKDNNVGWRARALSRSSLECPSSCNDALNMTSSAGAAEVACRAAISCPVTRFQVLTPSPELVYEPVAPGESGRGIERDTRWPGTARSLSLTVDETRPLKISDRRERASPHKPNTLHRLF